MLASNGNSLSTRSLKVPAPGALKPIATSASAPGTTTSNIALFLTNIRLLNLDLRNDWPDISVKTFPKKDAQQNQKRRIQCVEWALYQLFALWDPEEAQNKLQPFFPPLEPLQSLNLRAALFRCLDQAKKTGILGRDTVLRKTMLDECKGERLEEVLAVFSNAVLKKVLQQEGLVQHHAIAQQLAHENFSYYGERTVLSTLILAHKASLRKHLQYKEASRARYKDFSELLDLNQRRISRRHEQLKEVLAERENYDYLSPPDVKSLQSQVQKNWSGSEDWLGTILHGDSQVGEAGLLTTPFDKVWKHVENGSIGDVEIKGRIGLLEQLDARVKDQENRVARWKEFSKSLSKQSRATSSRTAKSFQVKQKKIDLGFNLHQKIQINGGNSTKPTPILESTAFDEYRRILENMKSEMTEIRNPKTSRAPRQSVGAQKRLSLLVPPASPFEEDRVPAEDEWSSASDLETSPGFFAHASKSVSHTSPPETPIAAPTKDAMKSCDGGGPEIEYSARLKPEPAEEESTLVAAELPSSVDRALSPSPLPPPLATPPRRLSPSHPKQDTENELADQILSLMSAASPSPKKARHTLSLEERTRMSMSRQNQNSSLHDDFDIHDAPRFSIKPRQSLAPRAPVEESDVHAGLIERTRKSMAGFEAAQKKAQLERRRSVKDAKKKQRESSYFPKVQEEAEVPDISAVELLEEGDPDYESVFKSRPKIKTSPAVSPTRGIIEEEEYE